MPEDQRYTDDNFYRKGQFAVKFLLDEQEAELDEEARYRALQLMLYAIRDEVGMKPSSFVDVYEEEDENGETYTVGEFLIYNKLGVTSLGKLKRFMDDHLIGDTNARVLLIDPKTEARFEATEFTIQYLFHDFIAGNHKGNWEDLKSFLKQEDKGYAALTQKKLAHTARRFEGPPPEQGATSIKGDAVKPLLDQVEGLIRSGVLTPGESTIVDYGAGKYSRNADALRKLGFAVYAYDLFNATGGSGWEMGSVTDVLPSEQFDLAFTSYVLNVVPDSTEDEILATTESLAPLVLHITRNKDVSTMLAGALQRYIDGKTDKNATLVGNFFVDEFATSTQLEEFEQHGVYEDTVRELAEYGVPTSKGFQRIPILEDKGYAKVRDSSNFKAYTKGY